MKLNFHCTSRVALALAVLFAVAACPLHAAPGNIAHVTFVVRVPVTTPPGFNVWISGDLIELGAWNGAGIRLDPAGKGRYAGTTSLPRGKPFEFKATRGSWDTVEKDGGGGEIANRRAVAGDGDTVRLEVAAWRDQVEPKSASLKHTLSGHVLVRHLEATDGLLPRDLWIYLPPGYDRDTLARYPVIYFHDGNNVFDAATSFKGIEWGVDETAERMIAAGELRPFIAVGVGNTAARMQEYTPGGPARTGANGHVFVSFLATRLKPSIDREFRTFPDSAHTGIVGSSLGGLISLYALTAGHGEFALLGCMSPSAWWGGGAMARMARGLGRGDRIWLDIGTREGSSPESAVRDARAVRDSLVAAGYQEGEDLHYEEVEGAVHDEGAWAARVGRVLKFLLK